MTIRCPNCRGTIEVETLLPGEGPPCITCGDCAESLSLMAAGELGVTAEEQTQRARQFAEFNQIDLPSAYTVLLGLMTPKQAHETAGESSDKPAQKQPTVAVPAPPAPSGATAPPPPGTGNAGNRPFGTGFDDAVRTGHLSRQQAMQRGDRRVFATQLARRHGLPMHLAELVADNKLSLHSATQRIRPPVVPLEERPVTGRQKVLMLGFAAVLFIFVVAQVRSQLEGNIAAGRAAETNQMASTAETAIAADPAPRTVGVSPTTRIETDDEGRPLRIVSNTPDAILEAYCTQGPQSERFEPLELANSIPPSSRARLGIMRNFDDFDAPYVIDIFKDRDNGSWSAGNGMDPIIPYVAPHALDEPARIAAGI